MDTTASSYVHPGTGALFETVEGDQMSVTWAGETVVCSTAEARRLWGQLSAYRRQHPLSDYTRQLHGW